MSDVLALLIDGFLLYMRHHVPRAAAALAYFLLLSIFPMLVCLYEMLGSMFPGPAAVRAMFGGLLPEDIVNTVLEFITYVSGNRSRSMLVMSLMAMASTSAGAFRVTDNIIAELRGKKRYTGFFALLFSFAFSIVFLISVYFAAVLMLTGSWLMMHLETRFYFLDISGVWQWLRFVLLFLLLFVITLGLYKITQPKGSRGHTLQGALLSSALLVAVSIIFSFFISASTKYPLIYGSLASVMILMLWLYICSNIIISGSIVNIVLDKKR